ncbi:hypothetical protein BLNAU_13310 [Blattamonas nauphoetae]|uniref:Tail specific protease domain-containing protein n=1 Tax=Blattamonas nauphoetae TaxID=2049346 RepID=A0ABQ9XGV6_9EUKA|nr:hypothetical protein BLNAU_13310 [Blattamonas nauphoetae]
MFILFLHLLSNVVADNPCELTSRKLYKVSEAVTCLRTLTKGVNDTELNSMPDTIKQYMDSYIFRDLLGNLSGPYQNLKMDLFDEIDKINVDRFETAMDYYEALMTLIKRLKDPHTLFTPPCRFYFFFALPYSFDAVPDPLSSTNISMYARFVSNRRLTESYLASGGIDITDKKITRISLNGEYFLENETASVTIAKWADEHVVFSKDPSARFHRALFYDFSHRDASMYESPLTDEILVEYEDSQTGLSVVKLPFYSYVRAPISKLEDICPLYEPETHKSKYLPLSTQLSQQIIDDREWEAFSDRFQYPPEYLVKDRMTPSDFLSTDQPFLVLANTSEFYAVIHESSNFALIKLHSFLPPDRSKFSSKLTAALLEIVQKKVSFLILDVRGNGGGYPQLAFQLASIFLPSAYPHYGIYDLKVNKVNDVISQVPEDNMVHRDPKTNEQLDPMEYYQRRVNRTFISANGTTFVSEYLQPYMMDQSSPDYFYELRHKLEKHTPTSPLFERSQLYVVTDGLCGSACAGFVKRLQENKAARVIGLGGSPTATSPLFDSTSYSGGSVFSSSSILAIKEEMPELNISQLPPTMFRSSAKITWTRHEIFSFEYKEREEQTVLEFKKHPVDVAIPFYANPHDMSEEALHSLYSCLAPQLGKCVPNEISVELVGCKYWKTMRHALFGYKCDEETGLFNTSKCYFSRCDDGYYKKGNVCVAYPGTQKANNIWWIVLIASLSVVLVIGLAAIVCGFYHIHSTRRKLKKASDQEKQPINTSKITGYSSTFTGEI